MGFYLRPLGVRQNKAVHPELESRNGRSVNPKSQQALVEHDFPPDLKAVQAAGRTVAISRVDSEPLEYVE